MKKTVPSPKFKKANIFLYSILCAVCLWARIHFRIKFKREELKAVRRLESPVLVLCTHHSGYDFAILSSALFPKRLSIVVAENVYYSPFGKFARAVGNSIPKKQGLSDASTVMNIKKMLNAGLSVAIFPEGRFSIDGTEGKVSPTLFKLLKWLKVPVVLLVSHGSYQIRPRWANDYRVGKVRPELKVLFTPEELEKLSEKEIREKFTSNFRFNDFVFQTENNIRVKTKRGNAEGLRHLLYKCPKCGAEFAHEENGDFMECGVCGNKIFFDDYGRISPVGDSAYFERPDLWNKYQKEALRKEIASTDNYSLSHEVELEFPEGKTFGHADRGVLTLGSEGFLYEGEKLGKVKFKMPNPPALSIDLCNFIGLTSDDGETIYRFVFPGKERPMKMNLAAEIIFELNQSMKVK
jgi:1-acyl-sn-glycerol-3-phosphate acyltransferase